MGNPSSQRNARSLREILIGLNNIEQHRVAAQWAKEHGRAIDLFGEFARFATKDEIQMFTASMDFLSTGDDGKFSNGNIMLWDIYPKNVLVGDDGTMFVIDAEIDKVQKI